LTATPPSIVLELTTTGWNRGLAYAGTANNALEQLDDAYARWLTGVRPLGEPDNPGSR
jgi:hypothetical protein